MARTLAWRAARAGSAGVLVGLAAMLLFALATRASLGRDLPTARAQVQAAFVESTLQDRDWLDGDTGIGHHQYNDCLILWQAIDQRAPAHELAVSPSRHVPEPPNSLCGDLRRFAGGGAAGPPDFYHRYVHGHTTLARYLLPRLGVAGMRSLYRTASTLLVVAGIAVAMIGLAAGRRTAQSLFWLIVFLAFGRWFGLESFGQSLSHGPSDILHLLFLLLLASTTLTEGVPRRALILAAAGFGAAVMIFEFLTGGIPLGLAAVIGGLPFATVRGGGDARTTLVWDALAAFCAAALTCLALKLLAAGAVFGFGSLADSASQLQVRLGLALDRGETQGVDLGPAFVAKRLIKGLGGMAAGMHVMAGATVLLALAAGGWGARRLLASGDLISRERAAALLLSNLAIALLLGLLWQHTLIHAWFMERTLAWTIASGFALFALALVQRRAGPSASPRS